MGCGMSNLVRIDIYGPDNLSKYDVLSHQNSRHQTGPNVVKLFVSETDTNV
jgi:hypothetical protein